MKRQDYINKIIRNLARFVEEVKGYNSGNLYDINIHAENALIPILNNIFSLQLINANAVNNQRYPAVDLVDDVNRVAFQITATSGIDKVKDTLEKFFENRLNEKYDTLYIYVLTQKQKSYSQIAISDVIQEGFVFDAKNHIIDVSDLNEKVTYLQPLEKIELLARLCEHEFSDRQIEERNKKFQSGFLKNDAEKLYLNILPIEFPDTLYVAKYDIDREAIAERMNDYRISMGWRKKKNFDIGALFFDEMRHREYFFQDFILNEGHVITFRNLHDIKEPLINLVDKGTIEAISTAQFYSTSEAHLRHFKYLLRQALIEFCKTKEMQWINARGLIRFKNNPAMPNAKKIRWKGINESTKTVIFEMWSKKTEKNPDQHIICFRSMAFRPSFVNFDNDWYLSINPTWSFTNPGGVHPSRYESSYLSGLKRQEGNSTVYYQYRFFSYHLSHVDLFSSINQYPYLKIKQQPPLLFKPQIDDSKWRPPKEFVPQNDKEAALDIDKELTRNLFD